MSMTAHSISINGGGAGGGSKNGLLLTCFLIVSVDVNVFSLLLLCC